MRIKPVKIEQQYRSAAALVCCLTGVANLAINKLKVENVHFAIKINSITPVEMEGKAGLRLNFSLKIAHPRYGVAFLTTKQLKVETEKAKRSLTESLAEVLSESGHPCIPRIVVSPSGASRHFIFPLIHS